MNSTECRTRAENVLMHTYGRYPVVLDRGEGVYLYDTDGKKYLDFSAGIGVFALGYKNEAYNDALKAQIDKLLHTSNYYYNEPTLLAAEGLVKASGMDRVFFTNSGTEAVEGAIKLARKYYYKKTGSADSQIIAMEHSFHGRSMGALSVTGKKAYREAFEPLIGGVVFAEFNDLEDVKSKINDKTAAIIMETLQGEGGIYPATKEFIEGVAAICKEKDIVLILDEIQCGMGRTGKMFCYQNYDIQPDIITSAKALGCGVPVGAFAATEKVAAAFEPGDHGTTYGGNPFVTAAVAKVFELFEEQKVLENVKENGAYLYEKLEEFAKETPSVVDHRGFGFMQGLEFDHPVKDIAAKALENGLILIAAGTHTIRFLPPLVMQKEQIDEMMEILKKCI
ncbi:MAG: aspartate aminotransferase family protein [Lachnospiraceae bacterium]|nr:aspartate aminotransferase family protein [Lachnospiraceae bacterium]